MCVVDLTPEMKEKDALVRSFVVNGRLPEDIPEYVKKALEDLCAYYDEATTGSNGEPLM